VLLPKLRAVDVRSRHQFEEEIGAASSENGFFIAKIEFSVRTAGSNQGPWHISMSPALSIALSDAYFDAIGLPRLSDKRRA
jgi:hypothetical protein